MHTQCILLNDSTSQRGLVFKRYFWMDAPFKKMLSQLGVNWSRLDKHVYTVKLNMSKILQIYRLFLREFNKVEKDLDLWKQQQQQKRPEKAKTSWTLQR